MGQGQLSIRIARTPIKPSHRYNLTNERYEPCVHGLYHGHFLSSARDERHRIRENLNRRQLYEEEMCVTGFHYILPVHRDFHFRDSNYKKIFEIFYDSRTDLYN